VTKGHTKVGLRPVQETSLAPPCLNLSYFGIKCPALKKKLATFLRFFGGAQWFRFQDIVPSSLRLWCDISRQGAQLWNLQVSECRTTSRNGESTTTLFRPDIQNAHRKTGEASPPGKPNTGKRPDVVLGLGAITTSPILLGPVLVWSQQSYLKLLLTVRYS